jgi:hypothetical protein
MPFGDHNRQKLYLFAIITAKNNFFDQILGLDPMWNVNRF